MELLNNITQFLSKLLNWWFIVMPWEQSIHIRKGKLLKIRGEGLYFRIPFIDTVFVQTTKLRMIDSPVQTLTAKDGNTITLKSCIGYSISDIGKMYNSLYHPETTLLSMSNGAIGKYIRDNDINAITPEAIEQVVLNELNKSEYGISQIQIRVTSFAIVRTYRLIQDGSSFYENINMQPLK